MGGILKTFAAYNWHFEDLIFNYWYSKKMVEISVTAEISDEKKIFGGGTWLGLFDSVFRIFTSGHFRLVLASDLGPKTRQTEVLKLYLQINGQTFRLKSSQKLFCSHQKIFWVESDLKM